MTTPPRRIGKPAGPFALLALLLAVACILPAGVPSVRAARGAASAAASLTDATVDAGDETQLRISVTNGDADDPPRAPVVDGLNIAYAGKNSSSQYTFNNGSFAQSTTTTYVYTVTTKKPGQFIIPGQEVSADGAVLRTLPITLNVVGDANGGAPGQKGPAFFELIVPKKSAYVGESVPIEMRANYSVGMQRDPDPNVILSGDGFSVQPFAPPKFAQTFAPGARYAVDSYKTAIAGLKIGTLNIGPASIEPVVRLPLRQGQGRQRGYVDPLEALMGPPFDASSNLAPRRQIHLDSPTVSLEVKPLPEAGKPANFSGAIGQFKLEGEASPTKARTGDPVTIRWRLSGQGNFDRVAPPTLADEKGLRTYPPTSKFKADDDVNLSGVKTFEQVVIAEGARTSLPSYHFNYFDPATGRYVTVDTPPLPVRIEGGNLATPTPASSAPAAGAPAATPAAAPTPPPRVPEDIHYILADPGPRRDAGAFLPLYRRPVFWEIQGGILAGVLALGGVAGWRARGRDAANQRAAQLARQQGDLQRALRREDTGRREFYTAATRLAQLRVGAAAGQGDAALSAADIARLKALDPRTAGSVQEIFDRHEESAYSGGAAAEAPIPAEERRGVLATLETIGRS